MIKTLVTLSEDQIKKIKIAYENKVPVRLLLSYEKIKKGGKYPLLLTKTQKELIETNRLLGRSVTLDLTYEQLKINHKGGYLNLFLAAIGAGAAIYTAIKNARHQAAEQEEVKRHNAEMEKIAQIKGTISIGSGLKKKAKSNRRQIRTLKG